jgi:FAD/FMN-containing dehydrogenase
VDLGGSISGEHGIGSDKREAMRWLFPAPTLDLFRRIKTSFDPDNLCNPDKLIPVAEGAPETRFAGAVPAGPLRPASVEELQEMLRSLSAERRPVFVRGRGTKGLAIPAGAAVLETEGLARLVDDDRANLTLTVQAGAALADVQAALAREGHFLAVAGGGTLGGILSANAMRRPPLRNQVLGLKAVLANGDLVVFGGKVMKNVAGYDAAKLFIGAWGALGVVVEVTLRVYAAPPEGLEPASPSLPDFARLPASDLHRQMKEIFDPRNLINPSLFSHE